MSSITCLLLIPKCPLPALRVGECPKLERTFAFLKKSVYLPEAFSKGSCCSIMKKVFPRKGFFPLKSWFYNYKEHGGDNMNSNLLAKFGTTLKRYLLIFISQ